MEDQTMDEATALMAVPLTAAADATAIAIAVLAEEVEEA
jgi:hypothetical protein